MPLLQLLLTKTLVGNQIQVTFNSSKQFFCNMPIIYECYPRYQILSFQHGKIANDRLVSLFFPIYQFSVATWIYRHSSFSF